MEAEHSKSTEIFSSNCNLTDVPGTKIAERVILSSESNISEERESTKTILEDVCTDFESMDVINPKSNKTYAIKKPDFSLTNSSIVKKNSKIDNTTAKVASADKQVMNEVAALNSSVVNEVLVDTLPATEINAQSDVASINTDIQSIQQSDTSVLNPDLHSNPELLPSNSYQNSSNITVLPESFAEEENIPLAQLADAEIVQSGDKVSIIVTNTRLIKVLTNNSENSIQSVIDPSNMILETSGSTTEQIGIIDPTILTDNSFQSINILDDSSVISEAVISDSENLSTTIIGKDSQLTEDQLNALRKHSNPKGRPIKKATRRSYQEIGQSTKARRITAKMKAEWAKQLEATGRLICEMPGCSQTYVTVANFQTHYKYCTGKKSLQHCLYCDSLIFSSHKAVLHHMEVEHPEKVEEYKAQYPEDNTEFEESSLAPHLIVAEDENVAMNVEEVTQQPLKNCRKRKLSSKENVVSKKHCILKHKMQSIQNTVTENIKEFKKCVRFGDIVDKINSVDIANSLELPIDNQNKSLKQKKERRRIILTESIVSEKKYFEDDEDVEPSKDPSEHSENDPVKLNTKARMLLNMERYKRYKEYLKLTRDWSSERRTYSRSRTSDTSFDSSYLMALQNEYIQDTHQLNDTAESSSISLNTSETEINPNVSYLEAFEAVEANQFASPVTSQPDVTLKEPPVSVTSVANENTVASSSELIASKNLVSPADKSNSFEPVLKREKSACYNRISFSNVQKNNEALRPKPPKFEGIITYGMTVPGHINKSVEPVVTFDSLISSIQQKQDKRNSNDKRTELTIEGENTSLKEDSAKQSGNVVVNNFETPKKKRGRPPKVKTDISVLQKAANDSKNKIEKDIKKSNAKKFSTAMLKSIEKNVKNRHAKIFVMKKKIKANSRKSRKTHLHSRHSNLKNIQRNKLKHKLIIATNKNIQRKNLKHSLMAVNTIISKQEMFNKGDSADESVIQCQENIDNHLLLGNETESSHIQSLVTEHNYSHIINSVIEDHSIADANNVATEIEVVTSTVENTLPSLEIKHKDESSTEKVTVNTNVSEPHEVDHSKVNQQSEVTIPENSTTDDKKDPESKQVDHSVLNQKSEKSAAEVTPVVENVPTSGKINHSDTQEKSENTPEIKVKRPRGRPRKNQNKGSELDMSNSQSPSLNTPNADKVDETERSGAKSLLSEGETPSSAGDKNNLSTVRKSERVKRRKLVDDEIFESPKVEAKKKEEKAVLFIRTGRRGRPRKVYPTDSEVDVSSNTPSLSEKCPENEYGSTDENLRKYSRKGRPRKCVRYADLNSGVDSSESLDGLNSSMKDKTEIQKIRGDKNKKILSSDHEGKDNSENNNSNEQDEVILLPLKKRKQRQSKKDDSLLEDVGNDIINKDTADSESIVDEEENLKKLEIDSEDDEIDDKKGTRSRNLRNSKNSKVSSRKKRIRHDSSDLEAELSSYITNKNESYTAPVTRRKSSNVDHLETEDQTSDNECDISYRKDSVKRLHDSSLINRRVSAKSVARSKEFKNAALKDSFQSAVNVLPDFKPKKYSWKLLCGKDYYDFSPPMKYSPYFKIEKTWTRCETGWRSLSIFDSMPIDRESCHGTFFTGGPVLCAAWCPMPVEDKVQYVALGISCCLDKYHAYNCTNPEKGLLQLWNVGRLHEKTLESRPEMELCIAHNYGVVTEMAWCPNGCWEDPSSECNGDVMPRLGMLAVACSDSNVRIYSIPHPTFITDKSSFPVYESHPSIVLQPMYGEICCVTKKSMCISLSWQKYDNCERVAAGFANGMICVWRINTSATILISKEGNQIKISPYLVFNAHGTPVTSVCFAPLPGGRFLVSSSSDKTLKFWDLTDISLPFFAVKKGAARSAEWAQHYCGAFASLDHGMHCFKGSSFFKECGTENFPSRLLSNPSCLVMKSTMSEFLNAQAIADMSGSVSVSFTHSLLQEHVKSPQYFHRPVYLTETAVVDGIIEKIAFSSYPESTDCIATIQEMKDIISVMNNVTHEHTGKRKFDINPQICQDEQFFVEDVIEDASTLGSLESITCLNAVQEMKNVVSVLLDITEKCENSVLHDQGSTDSIICDKAMLCEESISKENKVEELGDVLNHKISEVADIVTVVTDMKDITRIVDELVANSDDGRCEKNICSTESSADSSPEISLMEIKEASGNQPVSCLHDQVPLIPEKEFNRSMDAVGSLCSESVACISTVLDVREIVSIMNDVSEKCEENDLVKVGVESNKFETLEGAVETKYKCCLCQSSKFVLMEKPCTCENVTSVIQRMKDVVCSLSGVVQNCSKEANTFEGESYITSYTVELLRKLKFQTDGENKDERWIVQGIGLPFKLSDITDVVETVTDLRDITAIVDNLLKGFKDIESHLPCVSELNMTDFPTQSAKDSINHSHLKHLTVVPPETISEPSSVSIVHSSENILLTEISALLGDLIKFTSENIDNDLKIQYLLREMISNIEDKLNETVKPSSSIVTSENILEQEVDCTQCLKSVNVSKELISTKLSPGLSISIEDIQCNNHKSPVQNFNEKQLEVLVEDEPMLSADSESSSSENEMDTDDELEVADSFVYDQKSGFSDDSYMSECSLDSNISMCSYSCESDMSENSLDSIPADQEVTSSVLCSSSQNDVDEESKVPSGSPPSTLVLIPEIRQNLPLRGSDESELLGEDSTAPDLLNSQSGESKDNQSETTPLSEGNVPNSACQDTLVRNLQPCSEEPSKMGTLDISVNSEIANKMPPETICVSESSVAENGISLYSEDSLPDKQCISSTLSTENSCDINSSCTEVSENIVNTPCTENTSENIANQDDIYIEKASHIDYNVLPKIVEKNIFDSKNVSEAVNSEIDEGNEANASIPSTDSVTVVDKKSFSPGSLSSYADVISQYGLVFKDMNTAQFESIEERNIEESDSLDQYHLASIKTIAWNPNFGSHFWLFSGGQSGIARISYISDINECKSSKSREGKDA